MNISSMIFRETSRGLFQCPPAGLEIFPGMRSTVDGVMWGEKKNVEDQMIRGRYMLAKRMF